MKKEENSLKDTPTNMLVEELKKREGVKTEIADPDEKIVVEETGPVTVLVVID